MATQLRDSIEPTLDPAPIRARCLRLARACDHAATDATRAGRDPNLWPVKPARRWASRLRSYAAIPGDISHVAVLIGPNAHGPTIESAIRDCVIGLPTPGWDAYVATLVRKAA